MTTDKYEWTKREEIAWICKIGNVVRRPLDVAITANLVCGMMEHVAAVLGWDANEVIMEVKANDNSDPDYAGASVRFKIRPEKNNQALDFSMVVNAKKRYDQANGVTFWCDRDEATVHEIIFGDASSYLSIVDFIFAAMQRSAARAH